MKNKMAIRARAWPVNGSQIFAWQYGVSCPPVSGHDADAFHFFGPYQKLNNGST